MTRVIVTGANGVLGREVFAGLREKNADVKGLARSSPDNSQRRSDFVIGDLLELTSLEAAFAGADVIVHCASNPLSPQDDVRMVENILAATAPSTHIVFVSIAGIEDAKTYPYYQMKLDCEARLAASSRPHTIVRATQFHPFIDFLFQKLSMGPFLLRPAFTLQPVSVSFVAERIADNALANPQGRAPDIHGPEQLSSQALAQQWLKARGRSKISVPIPGFGPLAAFAKLRTVSGQSGGETWSRWLAANPQGVAAYG